MRLLPKTVNFYVYFDKVAANIVEGSQLLNRMMTGQGSIPELAEKIKALEHEADDTVHAVMNKLDTVFITPFDREDIHMLASRLDDVMDNIDGASKHMLLYEIAEAPAGMAPLTALLEKAAQATSRAVTKFRDLRRSKETMSEIIEINRIEEEGDQAVRQALAALFKNGTDAITVIKLKDIYENVENAIDRCEDVANVLEGVILKNG